MTSSTKLRRYHAPVWDEPVIMELGARGRRGVVIPDAEPTVREKARETSNLIPDTMMRSQPPALPEMSEFEVQRHYLRCRK